MALISQLKLLINLAFIDGEVGNRERQYILNIGKANGENEENLSPLFDQPHDMIVPDNLSDDQKFDFIFSLVQLMKIDEKLYRDEIKYCSAVASKLGYDQDIMFDLMINVKRVKMKDNEIAELKELTKKYLS